MEKKALCSLALAVRLVIMFIGAGLILVDHILNARALWFDPVASDAAVVEAVRDAKKNNIAIDERNDAGYTGLMRAILDFIFPRVQLFVEHGADVNLRVENDSKQDGDTPLLLAARFPPHATIAIYLLEHGADPLFVNKNGEAAFHKLLEMNNYDERLKLTRALVRHGGDINAQNKEGNTMIHLAVQRMDKKWIDMMRQEFGAILNLKLKNKEGLTPLEYARKLGMIGDDSVEMYLLKDYAVFGEGYGGYRKRTELGQNPLMLAIERDDKPFVEDMMRKAMPAGEVDNRGRSALFYAIESDNPKQYTNMMVDYGVPVNMQDKQGTTALMLVPSIKDSQERIAVAELLIRAGANPWLQDTSGNTIWHDAAQKGEVALLQALNKEIMVSTKNKQGETPVSITKRMLSSSTLAPDEKEQLKKTLEILEGSPAIIQ